MKKRTIHHEDKHEELVAREQCYINVKHSTLYDKFVECFSIRNFTICIDSVRFIAKVNGRTKRKGLENESQKKSQIESNN